MILLCVAIDRTLSNFPFPFHLASHSLLYIGWQLYIGSDIILFGQDEWTKHGTCAVSVPQVSGEFEYFNGTLAKRAAMDYYKCCITV